MTITRDRWSVVDFARGFRNDPCCFHLYPGLCRRALVRVNIIYPASKELSGCFREVAGG